MEYKYKYLYFILYIGSHVNFSYPKDLSPGSVEVVIIQIFILYLDSHFIFIR